MGGSDLRERLLEEIERRLAEQDAASPGPWRVSATGYSVKAQEDVAHGSRIVASVPGGGSARNETLEAWSRDGEAIAEARTGYPAALRALRREVERHQPNPMAGDQKFCACCEAQDGKTPEGWVKWAWPCPSIVDIARELGVKDE